MGMVDTCLAVQLVGLPALGYGIAFLSWSLDAIGWRRLLGAPILDKKEGGAKGDTLIVTEPYSYSRHPLYYSELHIIIGVFLVTGVFRSDHCFAVGYPDLCGNSKRGVRADRPVWGELHRICEEVPQDVPMD